MSNTSGDLKAPGPRKIAFIEADTGVLGILPSKSCTKNDSCQGKVSGPLEVIAYRKTETCESSPDAKVT